MAQFHAGGSDFMQSLTDCGKFMNGRCRLVDTCVYRHSFEARKQQSICHGWPDLCRNIQCQFRHPVALPQLRSTTLNSPVPLPLKNSAISFFWDIENVPIPRRQKPFDIVQRIRQKFVIEPGLQEVDFSCYCNSNSIPSENQQSLQHANVRIIHIPDRKPNAVDRQILLDLDRFERVHRPPATIVLISGDIDFVGKLSDLRHKARFHVVVIHNKPAKEELKATVNEHYSWELFTNTQATSSNRRSHSDNNRNVHPNSSPQAISKSSSKRGGHGRSVGDSRNNDYFANRNTSPPPLMQQRLIDRTPVVTSGIGQSSFLVYYLNGDNNTPQYPSSAAILPNTSEHRSIGQGANGTNRKISSERNGPKGCPFCIAVFDTIQALRQHQVNESHLYLCLGCDQGLFTYEGQIQHEKSKGHGPSEDTHNSTKKHRNYRSRNRNETDNEENYTSEEKEITVSSRNNVIEPASTAVVIEGLIEIVREIFK